MFLPSQIESILFVASKPLSHKEIAKAIQRKESEIKSAVEGLKLKYNRVESGIRILEINDKIQMSTNPLNSEAVDLFKKEEASGELTKAQLETLTVIAYRGPITRPELEQIRGVNCAVILRNLLIRGLVEEKEEEGKFLPTFSLSFEALRRLGVDGVVDLPEYEKIHQHEFIENILKKTPVES